MRIVEFTDMQSAQRIAALSEFLISRANDAGTEKTISLKRFIDLAHDMGVSLSAESLKSMIGKPPLNDLIQSIDYNDADPESGTVIFKGGPEENTDMPVDQARATVDKMAKRAAGSVTK